MKMSKAILKIVSIGFVLVCIVGGYVFFNMNSLAKDMIERLGTQALGVAVHVDTLDINLPDKSATLTGLKIANPQGFTDANALSVESINVALESVSSELIVFKAINVNGTNVNLEVRETGTNLMAIKQGMAASKSVEQKKSQDVASKASSQKEKSASQLKVIIKRFSMTKAQMMPRITLIKDANLSPVTVPDIILTDIGKKENGVLVREAIVQIWTHVSERLSKAASQAGFYKGLPDKILKSIKDGNFKALGDQLKDGLNDIGGRLKSLF